MLSSARPSWHRWSRYLRAVTRLKPAAWATSAAERPDLEPAHVWKVDVQQRKVRSELIDRVQCAVAGMHASGDLEAGHPLHVRRVQVGDPEVVIDDQGADQCGEATFSGMRTVKRAPPSLTTLTDPPWRSATCRTSARPKPRRFLPGPSLVLKPSWKI